MILDGKTVPIIYAYTPRTDIAIQWHQRADKNWRGCDRTVDEDVYQGSVTFRGLESELADLNTALDDKRQDLIANFNDSEEIFGADVDHTGDVPVIVTEYGKIRQVGFKVFERSLTLRLVNPSFKIVTPDITKLRTSSHSNTRETVFELNKMFTFDNQSIIIDHISNDGTESGQFTAQFTQRKDEMPAIRRYLSVTARANKIVFPTFGGITEPFGSRSGTGPFNCRVIRWADIGRQTFCDWNLSITFARDLSYWNE